MRRLLDKRFIISTLIFVFLIWGGYIFNIRIDDITLFIFNCPYNLSTVIDGSCLFFTELFDSDIIGNLSTVLLTLGTGILSIFVLGKLLCGYICPFGYIQDILFKIRGLFKIPTLKLGSIWKNTVDVLRFGILVLFFIGVGFCTFCPVRYVIPPLAGYQTELEIGFLITIVVLGLSFVNERFFCRICPLGTAIGLFNKVSPWKLKKNCGSCTECGICAEVCPMDIKEIYTERESSDVFMSNCILCEKCIDACPENDALQITLLNIPVCKSSRKKFYKRNR